MTNDDDLDNFDPDAFDLSAFDPPEQDAGLAQAGALAAEVRQGAASMVAVAGRIEATLIEFEERATARDKAIMQRVVDPEDLKRAAALGAVEGGRELARATTGGIAELVEPLRGQIEQDRHARDHWTKGVTKSIEELRGAAWSVGQHWEARRDRWQQLALALVVGLLLGGGSMFWLNRMALADAKAAGAEAQTRYFLENPQTFLKYKKEYDAKTGKEK